MKHKKLILICLIILISCSFIFAQTENQNNEEKEQTEVENIGKIVGESLQEDYIGIHDITYYKEKDENITELVFTGDEGYVKIGNNTFTNISKHTDDTNAKIILDKNGTILEADITASGDASFVFGEQTIDVSKGTRVIYKDGELKIIGNKDDEISLDYTIETENGEALTQTANLKLIDIGEIFIKQNTISGTNFQINDVTVEKGGLTLVSNGYLLEKSSQAEWKGLNLFNDENLLLATSEQRLDNYDNWIFPEEKRLRAKGKNFEIIFGEENPYAKIDSADIFAVKAIENFDFEIINRDSVGKIPKVTIEGEFAINEDYKSIYIENNEILIKKEGIIFGKAKVYSSTSPIELLIKDQSGELKKEKYLVSNFIGISIVPLNAEEGISDKRYEDSIYSIRALTDLRYNYPTLKDFEKISGKKVNYFIDDWGGLLDKEIPPGDIRKLIDFYETLPEEEKKRITSIKIYDEYSDEAKERGLNREIIGLYNRDDGSINLLSSYDLSVSIFRHEMAHSYHDLRLIDDTNVPSFIKDRETLRKEIISFEGFEYYEKNIQGKKISELTEEERKIYEVIGDKVKEYSEIIPTSYAGNNEFNSQWLTIAGGKEIYGVENLIEKDSQGQVIWKGEGSIFIDKGKEGFVRAYGAKNYGEDVATYVEKIVGEPTFFKKNNLIGEGADPRYKQKIDLLLEYGFITDEEYDAVFHPEKYGL